MSAHFPPHVLRAFRGHYGISQEILARQIAKTFGLPTCQSEISRLESKGSVHPLLPGYVSKYFRELGYDADERGDMIYVKP